MEIGEKIYNVLLGILILLILNFIKELPTFYNNWQIQKKSQRHERLLQQEAYYKQISGASIEELFRKWTEMFVDFTKMESFTAKDAQELTQLVIMYGSDKTVELYSKYMNVVFTGKIKSEMPELEDHIMLYFYATLLSSFKYDFTGFQVSPEYFLKSKINDYDEKFTKKILKEVKKYINKL